MDSKKVKLQVLEATVTPYDHVAGDDCNNDCGNHCSGCGECGCQGNCGH